MLTVNSTKYIAVDINIGFQHAVLANFEASLHNSVEALKVCVIVLAGK